MKKIGHESSNLSAHLRLLDNAATRIMSVIHRTVCCAREVLPLLNVHSF